MTLDPRSFFLGFIAAYVFSLLILGVIMVATWWEERKERERALDNLLADVAIRCIEHPTNARTN